MKKILVCGGGGFIGSHLVEKLKQQGNYVIAADLHYPYYSESVADKFYTVDLREQYNVRHLLSSDIDEIYQLAADMGGAGYIFTGDHDADIMHNSCQINLNILDEMRKKKIPKVFYSSSACMYPAYNQTDPDDPLCSEESAYPAEPDSEYGWEKLFSERLFMTYAKNYDIDVRIARFHNIFGPYGSWNNGKEKAPAAICRKVAEAREGGEVKIWGDGEQTRSFLYVDECLEGVRRLMESDCTVPVNIGSDEMITINGLVDIASKIANKTVIKNHISGPQGVRGRNSDNTFIEKMIGWKPSSKLEDGLKQTYAWIEEKLKLN